MKLSCERTIRQQPTIIQRLQEMLAIFTIHAAYPLLGPSSGGIFVLRGTHAPMECEIRPLVPSRHSVANVFLVTADLDHIDFSGSGPCSISVIGRQQPQSYAISKETKKCQHFICFRD